MSRGSTWSLGCHGHANGLLARWTEVGFEPAGSTRIPAAQTSVPVELGGRIRIGGEIASGTISADMSGPHEAGFASSSAASISGSHFLPRARLAFPPPSRHKSSRARRSRSRQVHRQCPVRRPDLFTRGFLKRFGCRRLGVLRSQAMPTMR
jgi:hypothetical protein